MSDKITDKCDICGEVPEIGIHRWSEFKCCDRCFPPSDKEIDEAREDEED